MKYAVIAISGTQYKVCEDQTITVDKIDLKEGEKSSVDQVLLFTDGDKVEVGQPTIKGAKVEFEIVKNYQDDKIDVATYRSKSRYRRHMGFRAQITDIKITKITL